MKSKISFIIAAFAILLSFAFISINKEDVSDAGHKISIINSQSQPVSAYAMEDENQWD